MRRTPAAGGTDALESARTAVAGARHVVVLTGAGVSAESGVESDPNSASSAP